MLDGQQDPAHTETLIGKRGNSGTDGPWISKSYLAANMTILVRD